MGLIDYISRHAVGKSQPPAYWDENFVVARIDDFIASLEFQDSTFSIIAMTSNPNGFLGTRALNRNKNGIASTSLATQTMFTVKSQLNTASGMSLPPFRRILRKCHYGTQNFIAFHPNNIASLDTLRHPLQLAIETCNHC